MSDFFLKQYDRLPVLRANLSTDDGYVDLSNTSVQFVYQRKNRLTPPTTGNASILGSASGYVEYAWPTGSTSSKGVYYGEWRVATSSGKQMTFPNDSYFVFELAEGLY